MQSIILVTLLAIAMPAGLGALGAVIARFLRTDGASRSISISIFMGLALVAGFPGAAGGLPPFPPIDSIGWLPILSLVATLVLVAVEPPAPRLSGVVYGLVAVLGGLGAFLVGRPTWAAAPLGVVALALGLTAVGSALASASLDSAARRLPVWSVLASLLLAATGASISSLLSSTALFAMLFGGVAAMLGGVMAAGWLFKSLAVPRAGLAVLALTMACQLLYVRLYAGLPLLSLGLAGASLFAPWAVASFVPARVRARPLLALVLTAALAGGAALAAFLASPAPAAGSGAGGDYVG